ncbi:hypothetical protein LCGC14_0894390 [marine sediment metagenome]|uniref:Uncharacterized protein n=1 Tax=marine sediment metagenome TaxID=412755 RepID=A0A0F9P345_9ZZZZ
MSLLTDAELRYHWTVPEALSSTHYGILSAVADASQTVTLKAVAEWMDGRCTGRHANVGNAWRVRCDSCLALLAIALREGKMPGEEK